jgi:hypothetical protein
MINGAPVNVKDFGAVGDYFLPNGSLNPSPTNDTAAVQAAINYALANRLGVEVSGICYLTASINIDRLVDTDSAQEWFRVGSISNGGFGINTAIPMFSTTLVNPSGANLPVTQLTSFEGLSFIAQGLGKTSTGYVLDGNKFLRTQFVSCSFNQIKCLSANNYVQSMYFIACNARQWQGNFYNNSGTTNYDIQVISGLYEAGDGNCFVAFQPTGCKFHTIIEGMSGTALLLNKCQGVDICCYFEANDVDFDCSDGNYLNFGVNLHGSFTAVPNSGYAFKWGPGTGLVSEGNVMAGAGIMHSLPHGSATTLAINDFAQSPGTLSDSPFVSPNSGIKLGSLPSLSLRGANDADYTTTNITSYVSNVGKVCTINFKATLTSTATHVSADRLYVVTDLPFSSTFDNAPCGNVFIDNQVYPWIIDGFAAPRILTLANAIPANVLGDSWVVVGQITYQTP